MKLSLQMFNGCEILADGQVVPKGNSPIPNYPTTCSDPLASDPTNDGPANPTGSMQLMADTSYFLNELTLLETVTNTSPATDDATQALRWVVRNSSFSSLDWTNLGQSYDDWTMNGDESWNHEIYFGNATWMNRTDDTFKVEVIDPDGNSRSTTVYNHKDFLGESPIAGHTRVSWKVMNIIAPKFPGDTTTVAPPPSGGGFPTSVMFRDMIRVDLTGSTDPFKSFKIPAGLTGDGAIKVTWSQMPDHPYYFPVSFVRKSDVPPTCYSADGGFTPCGFGVNPQVKITEPNNGKFFQPGESFNFYVDLQDGSGNHLHPSDSIPSYASMYAGQANGLLYSNTGQWPNLEERDAASAYQVAGPLQDLKPWSQPNDPAPFFNEAQHFIGLVDDAANGPFIPGMFDTTWPTRYPITIPNDAKPGTYVLLLKANRQFMGERLTKTNAFFFQVGQEAKTKYPGNVGNCQICHRSVISLDNLRHGLSVDNVEACKTCHDAIDDEPGRLQVIIHKIHMRSTKYPLPKNDCTVCHLTRQSAVRPSFDVCSSCHASVHGGQFFSVQFDATGAGGRSGNCAQSCHVTTTPVNHILPN